ncbi:preprotein translocase subunit SecA [Candidatus Poribacteria bacterium]|nr:preprotein translocase subunit SecA [Candidatus Poribacteria bacterium]
MLNYVMQKIVGSKNDRELKKLSAVAAHIGTLEPAAHALTDTELCAKTDEFRSRLENGEALDDIMAEAFSVVREMAHRTIGERAYDVQVLGAVALHQGRIAEMRTGEGKTLASTMPAYLNALTRRGVHVVTTNEYLAARDADWMGSIHRALGLTVGVTLEGGTFAQKKAAYECDITYGTNSEFTFDYLRDHSSARHPDQKVQPELHYAVVDEVDSILIDEARSPHIISEPRKDTVDYMRVVRVVEKLKRDEHFEIDEKRSKKASITLTEEGVDRLEKAFNVTNMYDPVNIDLVHHCTQSLVAHFTYERDVDYVVNEGRVVIVDEFTGRMQPERRFGDGLHQALEAKERVRIADESHTVARITFQNYFRMYEKLAGMTGTAVTESTEFHQIYGLDVVVVPTNRPMVRDDRSDLVFRDYAGKMRAVVTDIVEANTQGRPVLVGTISVEASEVYSRELTKAGVPHRVLNAKEHEKEAEVIALAGQPHAVTIATNMAGRGVDIHLGEGVIGMGGLYVIGTERHDSRRIDNQLRGRSGRQGDPGASRFYLSLEDDLMRKFGSDRMMGAMDRLGMESDIPIEHKMLTRAILKAQERVEQQHFEIRKQILKYDNVLSQQRELVYDIRDRVLGDESLRDDVLDMIESTIEAKVAEHMPEEEPDAWNVDGLAQFATRNCGVDLEGVDLTRDGIEPDEAIEQLRKAFHRQYDHREQLLGSETMRQVERLIVLDRIDYHWMQHLHSIDYIQEGIGFRGYAGRDPVVEFQKEGFELFETMMGRLHEDIAQFVYRVQVQQTGQPTVGTPQGEHDPDAAPPPVRPTNIRPREQVSRTKVGRNEPCPCGSGKKHKRCCGRMTG